MKRYFALCLVCILVLSGCMFKKEDLSGYTRNDVIVPVSHPVTESIEEESGESITETNETSQNNVTDEPEEIDEPVVNVADDSVPAGSLLTSEQLGMTIEELGTAREDQLENSETEVVSEASYELIGKNDVTDAFEVISEAGKKTGKINNENSKTEKSGDSKADTEKNDEENKSSDKKNKKDKKDKETKEKTEAKTFEELAPTVNMTFEELVGDNGVYGLPEGFPEPGTYRIIVDLYHQVVMAYTQDENGEYTIPVRYMLCSSGADKTQSPTGTFKMRNYRVRFALFNNTTSYAQYWSLITGRIYFHSLLYSAKDAAKYTETSYRNLGTNVSHGCIRLFVPDARWIWYNCAPGTEVEIRRGKKSDTETVAIREKLTKAKLPSTRPKLKAGKIPWTDNWKIEDVPHEVGFENGSQ